MLRAIAILILGIALGLATAVGAMWSMVGQGSVRVGPWVTPLDAGGVGRGAYLRAAAALRATLALSRREAIYFRATTDSGGQPLRGDCTYLVRGTDLPARWWSITLYGADHYLIANPANRYAYASASVAHDPDGGFSIHISSTKQDGNWLDPAGTPRFVLLTRVYQPKPEAAAAPQDLQLPRIERQECR